MTLWRIRVCGNGWVIHLISDIKPYMRENELMYNVVNEKDSDTFLRVDWDAVSLISIREVDESEVFPVAKESTVDLKNPFKSTEILTAKDNKRYVSLMRATELIREAAKR